MISPGVSPISHLEDPIRAAVEAAERAAAAGTFGVGGVLLGPHGEALAVSCNCVVRDGAVYDPTAHGERQLIDWYYAQCQLPGEPRVPPPDQCTIVSSLDPCMMCAGSILRTGFRVVSAAHDPAAGVNWQGDGLFQSLPGELRGQARDQFGYLGVEGGRAYQGPPALAGRISAELEERARTTFERSLPRVQKLVYASESKRATERQFQPELRELLRDAAAPNAAALLDAQGNLLFITGGQENLSPLRTPFMELTRGYTRARAENPELPHFKDCRLLTWLGPGRDPASIMDLGAYGSSVEGPLPRSPLARWQYVVERQPQSQLEAMIADLPPLYNQTIGVRVEPLLTA